MAPQIGPNDAPTIVKNEIRLAATPVTARRIPTAAPAIVEATRGTLGIIVLKLFPAMKAQKQVGGTEAIANSRNIAEPIGPPMVWITASKFQPSAGFDPCAPATEIKGSPAAINAARVMPTSPPHFTSDSLRALVPKSAPAAPAVAKKPITIAITAVKAPYEFSCPAGTW